ncbi:hypothetical protein [Kitasatospora sp. NPDC001683]
MTAADSALDAITAIDTHTIRAELANLRAIREWALRQLNLDYQPGDRVVITSNEPSESGGGWAHYSEALAPGQTGIAGEITYNQYRGRWSVLVGMDHAWATSEQYDGTVTRYWSGPAAETPDGYEPPSRYDQEHHPDGRVKHFAMDVTWVRKATNCGEDQ